MSFSFLPPCKLLGYVSYMSALEPSHSQFVITGHATAVKCSDGRGSIGTAASYFVHCILTGFRVRQTHYNHSMMKQRNMKTDGSCFLPTMLGTAGRDRKSTRLNSSHG